MKKPHIRKVSPGWWAIFADRVSPREIAGASRFEALARRGPFRKNEIGEGCEWTGDAKPG